MKNFPFILIAIDYIKNLKIYTDAGQKFVLHSNSKTRFLGFIMAMTNFKLMYTEYCENLKGPHLDYILTFKFSQDHLALQFASAYK